MSKHTKRCCTCGEDKTQDQYERRADRRCAACWQQVRQAAVCRYCGSFAGIGARNQPRTVCDEPDCQAKIEDDWRKAQMKAFQRRAERLRNRKTKRCANCAERKPLNTDHFIPNTRDRETGQVVKWDPYCRPCLFAIRRDRYRNDPAYRERMLRSSAEWARRKKLGIAAQTNRHPQRLRVVPAAGQDTSGMAQSWTYVPVQPIYENVVLPRLKVRLSEAVGAISSHDGRSGLRSLPDMHDREQLRKAVETAAGLGIATIGPVADELGVSDRTINSWVTGERPTLRSTVAEEILMRTDLFWWDVVAPGDDGFEEYRAVFEGDEEAQAA